MPSHRKGSSTKSHTRKVRTALGGTKTVTVRGTYRHGTMTKTKKKKLY